MSKLKYKILKEEFDISQGLLKDLTEVVDELMKENKKLKKNEEEKKGRKEMSDELTYESRILDLKAQVQALEDEIEVLKDKLKLYQDYYIKNHENIQI